MPLPSTYTDTSRKELAELDQARKRSQPTVGVKGLPGGARAAVHCGPSRIHPTRLPNEERGVVIVVAMDSVTSLLCVQ